MIITIISLQAVNHLKISSSDVFPCLFFIIFLYNHIWLISDVLSGIAEVIECFENIGQGKLQLPNSVWSGFKIFLPTGCGCLQTNKNFSSVFLFCRKRRRQNYYFTSPTNATDVPFLFTENRQLSLCFFPFFFFLFFFYFWWLVEKAEDRTDTIKQEKLMAK